MSNITSYSRIQVTVEITGSSYGSEWRLAELVKQSKNEAIQALQNKLADKGVKIIGEPKVLCITHLED